MDRALRAPEVGTIEVAGGIASEDLRSDAMRPRGEVPGLSDIAVAVADGEEGVHEPSPPAIVWLVGDDL
jgi:hypothetical protein